MFDFTMQIYTRRNFQSLFHSMQ